MKDNNIWLILLLCILVFCLSILDWHSSRKIEKIDNKLNKLDKKFSEQILKEEKKDIIPAKKNKEIESPLEVLQKKIMIEEKSLIDMQKIIQIESSGNPKAHNKRTNARGLCQIRRLTWYECCSKLGYDWSFDEAFNPAKNMQIGNYYMNTRIPQMLKVFNIPDNIDNRLIAYNWGIGNLDKARKSYGKIDLPKETQNYIEKYKGM